MSGSIASAETEGPAPRARVVAVAARPARFIVALSLAAVVAAGLWLVVTARKPGSMSGRSRGVRLLTIDRPFPAGGRFASDPYIGPRVCGECHPGEAAEHSRCGHAQTLRPAGRVAVARRLDGRS